MSRSLSVCQGGFLELGYDSVSFPYLIQAKKNRLSGIFIDFFEDAARLLHCENGARYTEFPSNGQNVICSGQYNITQQQHVTTSRVSIISTERLRTEWYQVLLFFANELFSSDFHICHFLIHESTRCLSSLIHSSYSNEYEGSIRNFFFI